MNTTTFDTIKTKLEDDLKVKGRDKDGAWLVNYNDVLSILKNIIQKEV